jgi:hypothetical protein
MLPRQLYFAVIPAARLQEHRRARMEVVDKRGSSKVQPSAYASTTLKPNSSPSKIERGGSLAMPSPSRLVSQRLSHTVALGQPSRYGQSYRSTPKRRSVLFCASTVPRRMVFYSNRSSQETALAVGLSSAHALARSIASKRSMKIRMLFYALT